MIGIGERGHKYTMLIHQMETREMSYVEEEGEHCVLNERNCLAYIRGKVEGAMYFVYKRDGRERNFWSM